MYRITDRIELNPKVHHGKPVVAGTRVPVHTNNTLDEEAGL